MTVHELVLSRLHTDTPTRRFLEAILQQPSWVVTVVAGCEAGVGCTAAYNPIVPVEQHLLALAELLALRNKVNIVEHRGMRVWAETVEGEASRMVVHATRFAGGWHLVVAIKQKRRAVATLALFT